MAGTSDLPAGREAARTLAFAGQPYREYTDVGVAGLWRLLERIDDIRSSPVVIVAAGMDAALVSVVGGLVASAVIALPTSVGYGVARDGATALHAALASCAPGISVVNIDNGYGAACAALRICAPSRRRKTKSSALSEGLPSGFNESLPSCASARADRRQEPGAYIVEVSDVTAEVRPSPPSCAQR